MALPRPSGGYDVEDQARTREQIWREMGKAYVRGQDVELVKDARLILVDTVTHARVAVTVANGALVVTALV